MRIPALSLTALFLAILLGSCNHPPDWKAQHYQEHSLVGTIWRVADTKQVTEANFLADLAAADYILLGETHDNPDHHRLQAYSITQLESLGRSPAVGFEMLSASQASLLAEYLANHPTDPTGIGNAVGWERSGWPDWSLYEPIARVALDAKLTIFPANADAGDIRRIARGEIPEFSSEDNRRFGVDVNIPTNIFASLSTEIAEAHCGYASPRMVTGMSRAQWSRDAHMATAMAEANVGDGAILIAGTGHARRDRGVPFHLLKLQSGHLIISVAFLEVSPGRDGIENYAEAFNGETLPFDYIWFTPRTDLRNPCERFEEKLKAMRNSKGNDTNK